MSITVSLETHMENAFEKFHSNLKFYNIVVSLDLLDHLDSLEANMYRLSKETSTTEMEEQFEDGYVSGLEAGGEDAYEAGYEQGYEAGYEAADEEFKEKIMGDT